MNNNINIERRKLIRELRILRNSLNDEIHFNKQKERVRNFYKTLRKCQYALPYLISAGITLTTLYVTLGSPVDEKFLYSFNYNKKNGKPIDNIDVHEFEHNQNEITFYGPWVQVNDKYVQEVRTFVLKELTVEEADSLFNKNIIAREAIVGDLLYSKTITTNEFKDNEDYLPFYSVSVYDADSGYSFVIRENENNDELPIELIYLISLLSSQVISYLVSKKIFLPFEYYERAINNRYPYIDTSFLRKKIKETEVKLARCRK